MHVTAIIPYRYWRNVKTGHKVSIHGACPYYSDADKANWEVVTNGFTQIWSNNTTRNSCLSKDECRAHGNRVNLARVEQLKDHARRYPDTAAQCRTMIHDIPVML